LSEEKVAEEAPRSLVVAIPDKWLRLLFKETATSKRSTFSIDAALKLLQALAIVAGGLWALQDYFRFKRDSQTLDLAQARLTTRLLELDERLKGRQVAALSQTPLVFKISTELERAGPCPAGNRLCEYQSRLRIGVTNLSTNIVDVSAAELKVLVGRLRSTPQGTYALRLNSPKEESGAIEWREVSRVSYRSVGAGWVPTPDDAAVGRVVSELAFGRVLGKEDTTFCSVLYRVRASPDEYLGWVVTFHTTGEGSEPWRYEFHQWRQLSKLGALDGSGEDLSRAGS
jgi:hypothetical protein